MTDSSFPTNTDEPEDLGLDQSLPASQDQEDLLAPKALLRDAAKDAGEAVLDAGLSVLYTGLIWASVALAFLFPAAGIVVGALFTFLNYRAGRDKFLPICVIILSGVFWFIFKSPLGMLPLVFELLG